MDALKLSELELRFFGDLFNYCDSGNKAIELFRTSQLSSEILEQITELCGGKRLGHFGRSQFYIALKLIAAAQLGLPLKLETFHTGLEIPLPKFSRIAETALVEKWPGQQLPVSSLQQTAKQQVPAGSYHQHVEPNLIYLKERQDNGTVSQVVGQLPPPPTKGQPRNNSSGVVNNQRSGIMYIDGDKVHMPSVPVVGGAGSPPTVEVGPSTSTSGTAGTVVVVPAPSGDVTPPGPGVLGSDKDWAAYVGNKLPLIPDSNSWQQFEDERQLLTTEDETSELHSSDEEYDIWSITDEQKEYYVNQFRSLQPDLGGLISGVVAKEFFEKSKLPVQELSKIWQLSDVNKDGALSLEEFFTAMHLVVLRRNNVELPETLPSVLVPKLKKQSSTDDSQSLTNNGNRGAGSLSRTSPELTSPHGKEWTHFNDSPNSSVSSPGIKPVNFDFQKSAVEQDPKILHPVPLRLSPESQIISSDEGELIKQVIVAEPIPYELLLEQQKSPAKRSISNQGNNGTLVVTSADGLVDTKLGPPPQAAIQRPIAKKPSIPGPGALPPPPQLAQVFSPNSDEMVEGTYPFPVSSFSGSSSAMSSSFHMGASSLPPGPKKEPPPPPPPRPKRNHARSSSLDLNRLGTPPAVPPRMSPSTTTPKKLVGQKSESDVEKMSASMGDSVNFANFTQFVTGDATSLPDTESKDVLQLKAGAFEIYKRPSDYNSQSDGSSSQASISKGSGGVTMKEDSVPLVDFNSNEHDDEDRCLPPSEKQQAATVAGNRQHRPAKDKKEAQAAIRHHQNRNAVLSRLNAELNQELSEVMEERIALEVQLELELTKPDSI